jgi:hypothetical protein
MLYYYIIFLWLEKYKLLHVYILPVCDNSAMAYVKKFRSSSEMSCKRDRDVLFFAVESRHRSRFLVIFSDNAQT